MSNTPWIEKRSLLDITFKRAAANLTPLDYGFIYVFKNGETRHCLDDREAYDFYDKNAARLNQPMVDRVKLDEPE
tara:strand:+ start:191 stop:415 length:225 start_codon:yes stop_codon:yes gene_type:complete